MEPAAGIHPTTTITWETPDESLEGVDALVGDARWVGLGEAIHTSGGYTEAKVRIFRYLVEHHGFRVLAMETPWIGAEWTREYVATCQGDPNDAMAGIFGVFADASTGRLLEWMCAWNRDHPDDPVQFTGLDVQQTAQDLRRVRALVGDDVPVSVLRPLLACGDGRARRCTRAVASVRKALPSPDPWLEVSLTGLVANAPKGERSYDARDLGMFQVATQLAALRFPEARVAVWAHDGHLAMAWDESGGHQFVSLGTHLARAHGDGYAPLSIAAWDEERNWGHFAPPQAPIPGEGSVLDELHALGTGAAFVDYRVAAGLDTERSLDGSLRYVPRDQFRGLVYLERSRPMYPPAFASLGHDLAHASSTGDATVWTWPGTAVEEVLAAAEARFGFVRVSAEQVEGVHHLTWAHPLDPSLTTTGTAGREGDHLRLQIDRPLSPPPVQAAGALPEAGAAALFGLLTPDRAALALDVDGALVALPQTLAFPETWVGQRLRIVCRIEGGSAVGCAVPSVVD